MADCLGFSCCPKPFIISPGISVEPHNPETAGNNASPGHGTKTRKSPVLVPATISCKQNFHDLQLLLLTTVLHYSAMLGYSLSRVHVMIIRLLLHKFDYYRSVCYYHQFHDDYYKYYCYEILLVILLCLLFLRCLLLRALLPLLLCYDCYTYYDYCRCCGSCYHYYCYYYDFAALVCLTINSGIATIACISIVTIFAVCNISAIIIATAGYPCYYNYHYNSNGHYGYYYHHDCYDY